jgi:type I restriction enzyme S subunit
MNKKLQPKLRFPEFNEEWRKNTLGKITSINMGQSPDSKSYNEDEIGLPLIQGNADIYNRKSQPRNFTSSPTKTCDIDDILMTVRAPVGAVAKSKHHACIGRGVCSIKSPNDFVYQYLMSYEDKWEKFHREAPLRLLTVQI